MNNKNHPELLIKNSDIEFSNVGFSYATTDEKAIKNINLKISGNTMAAFVGHSGAGKSTIINLLPRFYDPQEGSIKIDNQDIKKISLASLRKNLSLVSQDVILFDDTIKNNISYARQNASDKDIEQACKFAAADEFIEKLPEKYNTFIGENGVRLSGGQKQRISIARAILKESPIILLDEATSSLDADSEEIVQNAPDDWEILMLSNFTLNLKFDSNYRPWNNDWSALSYLINHKALYKLEKIKCPQENKYYSFEDVMVADNYLFRTFTTYVYKYPLFTFPENNDSTLHHDHVAYHEIYKNNNYFILENKNKYF